MKFHKGFFLEIIRYNNKTCNCKKRDKATNNNRMITDNMHKEDIVIPEYDEGNNDVSEEEYDKENDVMEETVIEREKGPELR